MDIQISPTSSVLHSTNLPFSDLTIFISVYGNFKPTEPTFFSPSTGLQETRHVASVKPYPSTIVTPEASSNLRKSSRGKGAEPEKEVLRKKYQRQLAAA